MTYLLLIMILVSGCRSATYDASGLSQIRHGIAPTYEQFPEHRDSGGFVIWRDYLSGRPRQLVYKMHGEAYGNEPRHGGVDGVYIFRGGWDFFPDKLIRVPPESETAAIARHTEVWGSAPGTELCNDTAAGNCMPIEEEERKAEQKGLELWLKLKGTNP